MSGSIRGVTRSTTSAGNLRFHPVIQKRWAHIQRGERVDVHDPIGNGWEDQHRIRTLPRLRGTAVVSRASADFFDGQHFVMKGASAHAAIAVRRGFRNWFRATYPYVYATFRCAGGPDVVA
jgi:formylglycine-generating enzyme required for sulfatase activity